MDNSTLLAFLTTAIILTLMPGPDILFVTAQSISQHRRAGIITALGLCTGLIVHISAAAFGVSAIIYQSTTAFMIIKLAGAIYLLFLAWQSFRSRHETYAIQKQKPLEHWSLYKKGIIMNVLNPKVSLFFLALLPQFVNEASANVSLQMIFLGIVFIVQALLVFTIVSFLAEKIGHLLAKHSTLSKKLNIIQSVLFTLIAMQIAFSEQS
ncbi:LysE family translocator [Pueribacillus sp. YX66]|uniref:LysE family translocator n=1 Tax=Pueribacillus sp. YX66 TaxID=3229242 RepID=UPI00358D060D